jgi:hypothetical protein
MRYRKYIFGLILFVCCPAIASSRAMAGGWHDYAQPVLEKSEAESDPLEYKSEEWYEEKSKLEVMIWASAIILTLLFFGLVLVTFIRMGRHYRKRVTGDTKPEPTEYVDAWSQYRLPEDEDDE